MGMLGTLMRHPDEISPLVKLKIAAMQAQRAIPKDENLAFCYRMLTRVSRSFSIVIQQLQPELRDAVCVFYLVLRGLDTVEDDMAIPIDIKVPILKAFHKHVYDPSWKFSCGEKDYKELMNKFEFVSNAFLNLEEGYQKVIAEMTDRMGTGMAKFIESEVITIEDYDEYCHYVAGIVGLGLSRLFYTSGLEAFQPDELSNSMGLFLQKTNIIRDYLEDINEIPRPRMFWPHEIWGRFATKLEDLKHEDNSENAVRCLNAMVTNALAHAIDCLKYMEAIEDEDNLRFCAIPQIMAIGTLAECYNNINVFRGVVKIRRGITAKIMLTSTMGDVYGTFFDFSTKIEKKVCHNFRLHDFGLKFRSMYMFMLASVCTSVVKDVQNFQEACCTRGKVEERYCEVEACHSVIDLLERVATTLEEYCREVEKSFSHSVMLRTSCVAHRRWRGSQEAIVFLGTVAWKSVALVKGETFTCYGIAGSDVGYRCGIGLSLHSRQLKLTEVLGGAD